MAEKPNDAVEAALVAIIEHLLDKAAERQAERVAFHASIRPHSTPDGNTSTTQ